MSECHDNCCDEGWDIYIDDKTYELYKKMGVPQIDSKISSTQPRKLIKKDGKCPFITPEGLCIFHRDYGEEYLSNTCRSYPRFVSTYEDVYLETLGMSCPATVKCVIDHSEPIVFKETTYYEEEAEIGKKAEASEAEKKARNVIYQFNPLSNTISTYIELLTEDSQNQKKCNLDREELMEVLRSETKGTPSERYVQELFDDISVTTNDISDIERNITAISKSFSCNVNRIWLFEHLMLESHKEKSDIKSVIKRGYVMWNLLLIALKRYICKNEDIDESILIDCTYKVMRIVDHGDRLLYVLVENL